MSTPVTQTEPTLNALIIQVVASTIRGLFTFLEGDETTAAIAACLGHIEDLVTKMPGTPLEKLRIVAARFGIEEEFADVLSKEEVANASSQMDDVAQRQRIKSIKWRVVDELYKLAVVQFTEDGQYYPERLRFYQMLTDGDLAHFSVEQQHLLCTMLGVDTYRFIQDLDIDLT